MTEASGRSKEELLEEARRRDIGGRSTMTKDELEEALRRRGGESLREPNGRWLHDHMLTVVLLALFFVSWVGQLYFQYRQEVHEALTHGQAAPSFSSTEFWVTFLSSVMENWQSEFLQLATMVILTAYVIHRDSPQSRDGSDELAADIKAIRDKLGA